MAGVIFFSLDDNDIIHREHDICLLDTAIKYTLNVHGMLYVFLYMPETNWSQVSIRQLHSSLLIIYSYYIMNNKNDEEYNMKILFPEDDNDRYNQHLPEDAQILFVCNQHQFPTRCPNMDLSFTRSLSYHNLEIHSEIISHISTLYQPKFNLSSSMSLFRSFDHVVVGGTWDHFHPGHRLLLCTALFLARKHLTIGITKPSMIRHKVLADLIDGLDVRSSNVRSFLAHTLMRDENNSFSTPIIELMPCTTPEADLLTRPDYDCLVISQEKPVVAVAESINEERKKRGLKSLPLIEVPLLHSSISKSNKVSSTGIRLDLLGTYLGRHSSFPWESSVSDLGTFLSSSSSSYRDEAKISEVSKLLYPPYIIGITGIISSGKSTIVQQLANELREQHTDELYVACIDSDQLARSTYEKNTPSYHKLLDTFSDSILSISSSGSASRRGEDDIDRSALGKIVFSKPEAKKQVEDIVWPATLSLVRDSINSAASNIEQGCDLQLVVLLEAALLLEAGWDRYCNEVWVVIAKREQTIERLIARNGLSKAEAHARIIAQLHHPSIAYDTMVEDSEQQHRDHEINVFDVDWRVQKADVVLATLNTIEENTLQLRKGCVGMKDRIMRRKGKT